MAAITWTEAIRRIYSLLKGAVDEDGKIEVSGGAGGAADEVTIINAPENPVPVDIVSGGGGNGGSAAIGDLVAEDEITWVSDTSEYVDISLDAPVEAGAKFALLVKNTNVTDVAVVVSNKDADSGDFYPLFRFTVMTSSANCYLINGLFAGGSDVRFYAQTQTASGTTSFIIRRA